MAITIIGRSTDKGPEFQRLQLKQVVSFEGAEFLGPWGTYQNFRLGDSQFADYYIMTLMTHLIIVTIPIIPNILILIP